MNIVKNMEAVFLVAVALVSGMGFATAGASTVKNTPVAAVQQSADTTMTVVTVSAKRLSAAEKAQLAH